MSYNTQHCLNYITRKIDFEIMADTIKKCGADIIGLQEMRDESEHEEYQAQAKILAEKLAFYYYFAEAIRFDGVNPYGNAIISRYPIKNAETVRRTAFIITYFKKEKDIILIENSYLNSEFLIRQIRSNSKNNNSQIILLLKENEE